MDGSSYPDIISTERRSSSAFTGLLAGIVLSTVLWAILAALIWLVLRH